MSRSSPSKRNMRHIKLTTYNKLRILFLALQGAVRRTREAGAPKPSVQNGIYGPTMAKPSFGVRLQSCAVMLPFLNPCLRLGRRSPVVMGDLQNSACRALPCASRTCDKASWCSKPPALRRLAVLMAPRSHSQYAM